jgi:hypothetical protein
MHFHSIANRLGVLCALFLHRTDLFACFSLAPILVCIPVHWRLALQQTE